MKKIILTLAVLLALGGTSYAGGTKAIANNTNINTVTGNPVANAGATAAVQTSLTNTIGGAGPNSGMGNGNGAGQSVSIQGAASGASGSLAASGPCIGESFQAGAQAFFVGANASYISESKKCNQRELVRLGMAFPDADVQARAKTAILNMFNDEFGAPPQPKSTQTSALPVATAPLQTASLPVLPPNCVGQNTKSAWYQANCEK